MLTVAMQVPGSELSNVLSMIEDPPVTNDQRKQRDSKFIKPDFDSSALRQALLRVNSVLIVIYLSKAIRRII